MNDVQVRRIAEHRARAKAKDAVHAHLAMVSSAIWILGVFFVHLFAPEHAQDRLATLAAVVLLAPAALVWLARPWLVATQAARRVEEEYVALLAAQSARLERDTDARSSMRSGV